MNHMPNICVKKYERTNDEFLELAIKYFETNSAYRGHVQVLGLLSNMNLDEYDLFEVTCDDVLAGLAAVKLVDSTVYFDIFVVEEGFRGIGVGDILFNEIINNEKFINAKNYESIALPGDRSTKNFFEQRSGKARLLIVGGLINR